MRNVGGDFLERIGVEDPLDPLARDELAARVLRVDALLSSPEPRRGALLGNDVASSGCRGGRFFWRGLCVDWRRGGSAWRAFVDRRVASRIRRVTHTVRCAIYSGWRITRFSGEGTRWLALEAGGRA